MSDTTFWGVGLLVWVYVLNAGAGYVVARERGANRPTAVACGAVAPIVWMLALPFVGRR